MNRADDQTEDDRLLLAARPEEATPASAAPQVIAAAVAVLDHLNERTAGRWEFDPLESGTGDQVIDLSWQEGFTVPIVLEDGTVAAALRLRVAPDETLSDDEHAVVRSFAQLLGAVISAERAAQQARAMAAEAAAAALSDQLTGLSNRRAWRQALRREARRCERRGSVASIAVVDLDDLKDINDREGHLAGDLIIKLAADTISTVVRGADLVARLGGDEFGVLAVDWDEPSAAPLVVRIRRALTKSGVLASVGGAMHVGGEDIMRTFHRADMEMYEAKRVRKGVRARDDDLL